MSQTPLLDHILILLVAAVVTVPVCRRLGLGAVLGYLVAGVAVGPWGLALIVEVEEIRQLGEFGVVFLLFLIGVELKPARLWVMRAVFGLGIAQVVVTGTVLTAVAVWVGVPGKAAVIVGFALALSSTAVGLQILNESGQLNTHAGRSAVAVLLLQDLALVPLLAMIPFLGETGSRPMTEVAAAAAEAILVVVTVVVAGRFLLRPIFRLVAGTAMAEIFAATAVLVVLGTAWLLGQVGLSMALGAFVAGLLLADTEYRHQVEADILPFRGFLLGLFFMTVSMSTDFGLLEANGLLVAALVGGLLAFKALVLWGLGRVFSLKQEDAVEVALLLAQSGEFAFVLFGAAATEDLMSRHLAHVLSLVVALTIAMTPLLAAWARRLARRPKKRRTAGPAMLGAAEDHAGGHVVIAGFGRFGQTVAHMLDRFDIPYLALDLQPERVSYGLDHGYAVFFGDAGRLDVLRAAGAERARLVVVAMDRREATDQAVAQLQQHHPHVPLYVRARDRAHGVSLRHSDSVITVRETVEARLQLGGAVLRGLGIAEPAVSKILDDLRREDYKLLDAVVPSRVDLG